MCRDRRLVVGLDRSEPGLLVKEDRFRHGRQSVQPHLPVADTLRLPDDGYDQRLAETKTARVRRDVKPLHLTAPVRLYRPQADASQRRAIAITREQQLAMRRRVFSGERRQFRVELLIAEIDPDR